MTALLIPLLATLVVGSGTYWLAEWLAAGLVGTTSDRATVVRSRGDVGG